VNGEGERVSEQESALFKVEFGLTCGVRGCTCHLSFARLTRTGEALADCPRVGADRPGVLMWQRLDSVVVDGSQSC
jgi:hypothetical protein